jgi:parvulin-like peptidyl-prolyl isomerase
MNRIIVDRDRLLAFMQYRSRIYDSDRAKDLLDNLPEEKLQAHLFAQDADEKIWRGPFRSLYGFHLVMVTRLTTGFVPPLSEVRQLVMQDAMEARKKKELDRIDQSIVDSYEVEVVDVLKRDMPSTQ